MNVRDTIDRTTDFAAKKMAPVVEQMEARLADLPETAIRHIPGAVTAKRSRRTSMLGFLAGAAVGAAAFYLFDPQRGADRRQALKSRLGMNGTAEVTAY